MGSLWPLLAQNITFHHLTTDEGLSQSSVTALYQDEMGFIWAGTREGLNRFTGHKIQTYKLQKNNPYSLFCNHILQLEGNKNRKIYILTTEGIAEYDVGTDRFTTLWKDGGIQAIHFSRELFVGKGNEIFTYNPQTAGFDLYYRLPDPKCAITALHMTPENTLYIGTETNGVFVLKHQQELTQPTQEGNIVSLYRDSEGDVWVGSWEHGLFRISDNQVTNFTEESGRSQGLASNFVRSCCEDNKGDIWIGTFRGLNKFDKGTGQFTQYKESNIPNGLTNSFAWCLIKDHQGTLWLGTYFGGINYFNPEYDIYTWYKTSTDGWSGLSSPIVSRMTEDKHRNLWICTEGGGLNVYNPTTQTFRWYKEEKGKQNCLVGNNVKSIYYEKDKDVMWVGTHKGLNRLDLRNDRFTYYKNSRAEIKHLLPDIICDIEPYGDQLILATFNGVYVFDPAKGTSQALSIEGHQSLAGKNVSDVYIDHRHTLWISVPGEGVYAYNFESQQLKLYRHDPSRPNSLSNNSVNSITQDSRHNLYFCTAGRGLDVYRYESDDFENYDSQNSGLSGDCVYNVCESKPGELFLTTSQGFSVFCVEAKRCYNYNKDNGFPLSPINENTLYLTREREVFLGGIQGMISFDQQALTFTEKPYDITFTNLYVNGVEITANDDTNILHTSLFTAPHITLKSNHTTITIEFAVSNYIAANEEYIIYQLEGFSKEWTTAQDRHYITYTNLNPGDYTLNVKSSGSNNRFVDEAQLHIKVLPPIYQTTMAYLLYIVLVLGITYYILRLYTKHLKLQASLKYEQQHLQDMEDLNQTKFRFFTHVSHEFRTPLTLIIGHMETLLDLQIFTPAVFNKLAKVYNSSLQLRELISELLDFQKQERGDMRIYVAEHNIVEFLYANYRLFEEYASGKQIDFRFEREEDIILAWYDERQMQKVINNLLSNAIKCTPAGEVIYIHVRQKDAQVIIEVGDTGIGIPEKDTERLFERFFQVERPGSVTSGTGIGLPLTKGILKLHHGDISVKSVINEGSVFRIALPLGNEHFTQEELTPIQDAIENFQIERNVDHKMSGIEPSPNLFYQEMEAQATLDARNRTAKVLIVEDNDSLRQMLAAIFEGYFQVITASDGQEGLEKVRSEMPHLVVSDIVMPYMTGIELCKAIKGDIDTCHIPVVLLTAKASINNNIEGLKIGADDYVIKPFNVALLLSRCNNLINSRIMLQEKFSRQPQTTPQMLATNALDKEFLDKATVVVGQYIDNPEFSVNEFAAEMGMSRTKLFSKLKAVTGQSPNEFISTIRLKQAARLLKNKPDLSIIDISIMVGFSSSRYFSKCFKEAYHIRPLDYRKEGPEVPKE